MKRLNTTLILFLAGLGLLGIVLFHSNLGEVWLRLKDVGGWGVIALLSIYFIAVIADVATWHLTMPSVPLNSLWLYRLWKVRMVGEAVNRITFLASLGGEPVKAMLLKRHYGIGYREGTASLVLSQTTSTISLVIFVCCGLLIALATGALPEPYGFIALISLMLFSVCTAMFFLIQRYKGLSWLGSRLLNGRFGLRGQALSQFIHDMEDRIVTFYTQHKRRLAASLGFSFADWLLGAIEIYTALWLLGHSVSVMDAWVIEAVVVLVRSIFFLVPAHLGTQDGALVLICGWVTGEPNLGVALAILARFRELVWIIWGLYIAWCFEVLAISQTRARAQGLPIND